MGLRWTDKDFDGVAELRRQLRQVERELDSRLPANISLSGLTSIRAGGRPPRPSGLQAQALTGRILLTWNVVNIADLMRYEVQISTNAALGGATTFTTGNNFFTFQQVTTGTTYYMRVRVLNTAGTPSEWSNIVSTAPRVLTSVEAPVSSTSPYVLVQTFAPTADQDQIVGQNLTDTDYDVYHLDFFNLAADTATNNRLYIQFYMDGTLKTDAMYDRIALEFDAVGPTHGQNAGTANSFINTSRATAEFSSARHGSGTIWFYKNRTTSLDPKVTWRYHFEDGGGVYTFMYGAGAYDNSVLGGTWDGFKLYFGNTGNRIDAGFRAYLYGHKQTA